MAISPSKLIEQINLVSEEFYKLSQELAEIAERSGTAWLKIRRDCSTNGEADRLWTATPDGRRENYLKIYLKGLQAKRGALILEYKSNAGDAW